MTELIAQQVVAEVKSWLGTPYQHQASLKHIGCDCLGLLRGVWRHVNGNEPEMTPAYAPRWNDAAQTDLLLAMADRNFDPNDKNDLPKAGDILLFKYRMHLPARHVAIAVSSNCFIHAYVGKGVVENSFSAWWQRHLAAHYSWR